MGRIAATATAAYLTAHAAASPATAADHGFATAMAWGAGILLVTAVPAIVLVNARAPPPRR
jgi:hypothetical protein